MLLIKFFNELYTLQAPSLFESDPSRAEQKQQKSYIWPSPPSLVGFGIFKISLREPLKEAIGRRIYFIDFGRELI
jgi:hypothetical protein